MRKRSVVVSVKYISDKKLMLNFNGSDGYLPGEKIYESRFPMAIEDSVLLPIRL
ncbi:MAG: hypothetical protein LBD72_00605 [Puniceicoccales bacterium]|nr:hypothetical protein [Puniceicoccales bacterium]